MRERDLAEFDEEEFRKKIIEFVEKVVEEKDESSN